MTRHRAYAGGRAGPPWRRPLLAGLFAILLLGLVVSKLASGGGPAPAEGEAAGGAAAPERIQIPSIGVSAHVIPLGLNRDGTLQVPRDYSQTGWYTAGPEPGERGPAVIVGHVDSKRGPGVFFRLPQLRHGDSVRVVRADGSTVSFTVDRLERWPKAEFPTDRVYGRTRGSVLRLVTCSGDFDEATGHYTANTIVYASRD